MLLLRRDSSLVFSPPSPPSIAVPAEGGLCLQPTTISLRSLPHPPRSARAPQKPRLQRRTPPSRLLCQGVPHREPTPSRPPAQPCLPLSHLALRHPRRRGRLPTASPLGRTDVQQQQLAMPPLLSTMALGPAGPLDHPPGVLTPRRESHGRGQPRPPPRPLLLPPRRSTRPTATTRSLWEPFIYGLRPLPATRRLHQQS